MDILLTGSVAFDYLMTFPGNFKDHILPERLETISLSFLVDSMTKMPGGIAPNIAYTMALLGSHPRLWAAVGEDFEEYRHALEAEGIDTSGMRVIPGVFTASFFVNTDRSNAQIASFYPGAMAHSAELSLKSVNPKPDLVVISPSDPFAMQRYCEECRELNIPFIYDPSQQIVRMSSDELQSGVEGAWAMFVNDYEYALIKKMTGLDAGAVLGNSPDSFVVVTCGKRGVEVYANLGSFETPSVQPKMVLDPTGVGDAFRGGFLTGLKYGFGFELCAQMGVMCATYCLEHKGSQGHRFTQQEFVSRFRENFDDRGSLDGLLE
ncbi:MAG: ribokinase [Anaerolineae bacterium UTCFX2]|nr:carbohydrate kinase family protein [Anaerolineales bacterium]OQY89272.1 MAG: ribokinase [Anaerolineae bacterium UTCFX2]